jgi:hypothetical protein
VSTLGRRIIAATAPSSRHESINSLDEDPGLYIVRHQATEQAFAQAIKLAKAKYGRCP